jgi:hypothetical protein
VHTWSRLPTWVSTGLERCEKAQSRHEAVARSAVSTHYDYGVTIRFVTGVAYQKPLVSPPSLQAPVARRSRDGLRLHFQARSRGGGRPLDPGPRRVEKTARGKADLFSRSISIVANGSENRLVVRKACIRFLPISGRTHR